MNQKPSFKNGVAVSAERYTDNDIISISGAADSEVPEDKTARRPADMLSREQLAALSTRRDDVGLIYFLAHFALIIAGAYLVYTQIGSWWIVPAIIAHGFVLSFLFSPLHECSHFTAFKTRWLNEAVLWVVALVYIVPPHWFRYYHLAHHRYTKIPEKDPEIVLPPPAGTPQWLWYCSALWYWHRNVGRMVRHAVGNIDPADPKDCLHVPKKMLPMMRTESQVLLTIYLAVIVASIYFGFFSLLVLCWWLPRIIGEPFQRFIRVAEHTGCDDSADLLRNTRTTITNWPLRAIAWQMPFHAEHHLFPNTPFHALPKAHALIADQLPFVDRKGYVSGQLSIVKNL